MVVYARCTCVSMAWLCVIYVFFLMESAAVCDICMEFTMNIDCSTMVSY